MLETTLDIRPLIDKALLERGEAILVLTQPTAGEGAVIDSANAEFERLVGRTGQLAGARLGSLRGLAEVPSEWSVFITSLRRLAPLQLDLRLMVGGRRRWLQFRLVFDTDDEERAAGALLIGRDVTRARRRESQEAETQRVLAGVFQHVGTAVAVVADDGAVLMANDAFQHLLGFGTDELAGLNVGRLAAADFQVAAAAARAKQLQDGVPFELRLDVLTRAGSRLPARLASVMLPDQGERQLRVVTLVPEAVRPGGKRPAAQAAGGAEPPDHYGMPGIAVGQVLVLSLQAIRTACGAAWPKIGPRAMMLAEQIIRRRLGGADVFSRSDDDGFVVWFGSPDAERNEAALASIVREVRLRFLLEMGGELAAQADTVAVADHTASAGAGHAADPLSLLMDERDRRDAEAVSLLQELRAARQGEMTAVADRDGRPMPWLAVDFAPALCRRLELAGGSLQCEGGGPAEIDLLRCDLALAELARRPSSEKVLVQFGWPTLAQPNSRRVLDDRLSRAGAEQRSRLVLLVAGVPPLLSAKRWTEVVLALRSQLADVAPVLSLAVGAQTLPQETIASEWPLTLAVVDGAAAGSVRADGYVGVITAARRRGAAVLARAATAAEMRDWRELGANLFIVTG